MVDVGHCGIEGRLFADDFGWGRRAEEDEASEVSRRILVSWKDANHAGSSTFRVMAVRSVGVVTPPSGWRCRA